MPDVDEHEGVLHAIEKMRVQAGEVERQLMTLHNSARFDHRLPGLADRAATIEHEARQLCDSVQQLRGRLERSKSENVKA